MLLVARQRRVTTAPKPSAPLLVTLLGVAFLLVQVVVLPGSASPFRLPKEALLVGALAVCASVAAALAVRRGELRLPLGRAARLLVALPLLQAASLLWSSNPGFTLQTTLTTAIWAVGVLWLATLTLAERHRLALWATAGVAVSSVVLALQTAGFEVLPIAESDAGSRRGLSGLTGNPADLAMAAALLLPLTLDALSGERGIRRWGLPALLAAAIMLSQTWTGYAALAGIAVAWLAHQRSRRQVATVAGVALLLLGIALAAGVGRRVDDAAAQLRRGDWYGLLSARSDGWTAAAEMIRQRPLLGVGAGCYTHDFYPARLSWLTAREATGGRGELATHFRWAHCDPLQFVAELGVPGVLWAAAMALVVWGRRRDHGALTPMMFAAGLPFALLHYPHHLAVGLLPMALAAARLIHDEPRILVGMPAGWPRRTMVLVLAALAAGVAVWQLQRLAVDRWRGGLEGALERLESLEERTRPAYAAVLEQQIEERIERLPSAAPWLWRKLGIARLGHRDHAGAEAAFRQARRLWPHEEAELGLGLALAAQGRRSEALVALGRVCRVNPELARFIPDRDLRYAVADLLAPRRPEGDAASASEDQQRQ